jgi:hypothetical protein
MSGYSDLVRDHFVNPRNPVCRDSRRLTVRAAAADYRRRAGS